MTTPQFQKASFVTVVVLVSIAFIALVLPFYGAILWAVVLAILFNSLQRRLERSFGGRKSLAAAVCTILCIFIVVIPVSLLLASLAREATNLYTRLSNREFDPAAILAQVRASLPTFVLDALARLNLAEFSEIQARLTAFIGQVTQAIATRALAIGQNTAQLLINLGVLIYLLFFLFRDGPRLVGAIRRSSPLNLRQTDYLFGQFAAVVKATVKGNVIIAAIQGTIGGVTFWLLGIEAALLWGVVMAMLSLLPAVGAFLVWAPVAIYFLLSGSYLKGILLFAVGVFVISLIDNLLRPPLVGKSTRLPDYLVLVSTLGGLALIGMNGFVIGPLVAALFLAVWSLLSQDDLSGRDTLIEDRDTDA
ncbi:AI-2E family transporter [Rhizobiaceae bacterium BDR2-2]|uniref:AI-2E family transporter n=1 Tax=Ectorhizobium quercum TaxID=2965071 RepID=A0AAE3SUR0_9HYPH|nr:AI-2E family transporter [Ectorhizobium quercum]MCX8997505.1 AI-2E family transporter [Ectorhizobium quercum]